MLGALKDVPKLLANGTLPEIKAVVRTFISKITIHQDERQARFHHLNLPGLGHKFADPATPARGAGLPTGMFP